MTQQANPLRMRQVIFNGPRDVHFAEVDLPPRPEGESVRVRTRLSLISPGTELALYTGTHVGLPDPSNKFAKYPFQPGYAAVGEVIALGPEAGAHVAPPAIGARVLGWQRHAEVFDMPASYEGGSTFIQVRDGVPDEHVPFARLAAISLSAALRARSLPGQRVAVIGLGMIGNFAAQLYQLQGARVLGADLRAQRLDIARQCGIMQVGRFETLEQFREGMQAQVGSDQADIVVEATGAPALVNLALELARPGGQVVVLGSPRGKVEINVYEHIHRRGVSMLGAHEALLGKGGIPGRSAAMQHALDLVSQGHVKVAPLLTHRLPPQRADEGYRMLLDEQSGALGVILDWVLLER